MQMHRSFFVAILVLSGSSVGCRSQREAKEAEPVSATKVPLPAPTAIAIAKAPVLEPPPDVPQAAVLVRLSVPGDLPVPFVASRRDAPKTVFLPGICSNAEGYLGTFPEAARAAGGVLAIDGDLPCAGHPGFRQFSWDAERQHRRIAAALTAAGTEDSAEVTLVGYSQGAVIAEQLAAHYPKRYAKIVLIGAPNAPVATNFRETRGFVGMSCARDVTARMKKAARDVGALKIPATYVEMPGCAHGGVGEAERTFSEAFVFLSKTDDAL